MIQKSNVVMAGLKIEMRPVLRAAWGVWWEHGQQLVVTSALDGEHASDTYHFYGYALDLRTRYFQSLQIVENVAEGLREAIIRNMGPFSGYTGIVKKDHIHVHYAADEI